jgi:hypothetical protein
MTVSTISGFEDVREQLLNHPIYKHLNTADRVRVLMKHHSFAVWDFMSLLKKLQQQVTCVTVPWIPVQHADYARFINEIVLGEETDEDVDGGYISHFELYLRAMDEVGADTELIRSFVAKLIDGIEPDVALQSDARIPQSVRHFVSNTLELALNGAPHEVASAFFFGREDLIPDMFQLLVDEVEASGLPADGLKYYLRRHIELDGDEHGPLAERLLISLCEGDPHKLEQAQAVARQSLQARIALWDGVLAEITAKGL